MTASAAACSGRERGAADAQARRSAGGNGAQPAAAGPSTGAAAHSSERTILFVGTSLTAGLGLDPDEAYPALIARKVDSLGLSYQVVNAGVSGETSADAVRRLGWLLKQPLDVFVLETGANDGLRGLSVDSMRANIAQIIDQVRTTHPAARILLVGMEAPPNMGPGYAAAFHRAYPEIARAKGVALVPFLLAGVAGVDTLNQRDGIHPNPRGAQIVADNVWKVLSGLLIPPAKGAASASP